MLCTATEGREHSLITNNGRRDRSNQKGAEMAQKTRNPNKKEKRKKKRKKNGSRDGLGGWADKWICEIAETLAAHAALLHPPFASVA